MDVKASAMRLVRVGLKQIWHFPIARCVLMFLNFLSLTLKRTEIKLINDITMRFDAPRWFRRYLNFCFVSRIHLCKLEHRKHSTANEINSNYTHFG